MDWGGRDGLLVLGHPQLSALPGPVLRLDLPQVVEAAAKLYATLHDWDEQGLDRIVIVPPPDSPEWVALRDRIWRATRPHRPA
jgi:L-threonylcarbamoyladenylate synthase